MLVSSTNCTSPKFVKPSPPTESLDASTPDLMSMPVRSRTAYAYSALVSRRTVTRPGSPACSASYALSVARIHAAVAARSSSDGKCSASSGGGITRVSSISATLFQSSQYAPTEC
jgi:hypothetical protein